jgi:transcriptional regulator with XRE-family HTH domain
MNRTEIHALGGLITAARGDVPMREVGRRSGLSAAQISRIEAGLVESPTFETLTALATALDRDPQLLLIAVGRIVGDEAVALVMRALSPVGGSAPRELREARKALGELDQRAGRLDEGRRAIQRDWQALAGQHDQLNAEAAELETAITTLLESEPHVAYASPSDAAVLKTRREESEMRLDVVRRDLEGIKRRGAAVRKDLTTREKVLSKALNRREDLVREVAGQLFVYGAATTDRVAEAVIESVDLPWAQSSAIADYIASIQAQYEKAVQTELAASSAATEQVQDQLREQIAKALTEPLAKTRAELDELTRRLRNQLAHDPGDADFRRLAAAWNRLTPERRARLLEFAEDQRALSLQEQVARGEVVGIEEPGIRSKRETRP